MKVLKIIHTLGHGGAENAFRWLAWGLRQRGIEAIAAIPEVSEPQQENWVASALEELEVPYLTFDKTGGPWRMLNSIRATIEQVQPDIVHSHLLDSNFYSGLACKSKSVTHICTEHGDVSFKHTTVRRLKYGAISLCSQSVVCVSEAVREKVAKIIPNKSKLKTIYNGIHFLERKGSSFRPEFQIPEDTVLIGNVGNLYPVKGQKYLIRAFAEVCCFCPKAVLVLVGRGREENNLRKMVKDLNIPQNRVIFTGFRNDIENVMNAFDLYVQPSLSEGHPLAVLEAMSLGIPVIATEVGGTPEILGPERYGTFAKSESSESLFLGIRCYLENRNLFSKKATIARNFVRNKFSIETMVENYLDCYKTYINGMKKSVT